MRLHVDSRARGIVNLLEISLAGLPRQWEDGCAIVSQGAHPVNSKPERLVHHGGSATVELLMGNRTTSAQAA